jgi:hypothetical protein
MDGVDGSVVWPVGSYGLLCEWVGDGGLCVLVSSFLTCALVQPVQVRLGDDLDCAR